jgi:hypothetical protein
VAASGEFSCIFPVSGKLDAGVQHTPSPAGGIFISRTLQIGLSAAQISLLRQKFARKMKLLRKLTFSLLSLYVCATL